MALAAWTSGKLYISYHICVIYVVGVKNDIPSLVIVTLLTALCFIYRNLVFPWPEELCSHTAIRI